MPNPDEIDLDDEQRKFEEEDEKNENKSDVKDFAQELANQFKEGMKDVVDAARQPAEPSGPTEEELQQARIERYNALRDEINEAAKEGDVAGAMEKYVQFLDSENKAKQKASPNVDPGYKALRSHAKQLAQSGHEEAFKLYGDEIEAEVDRLTKEDVSNGISVDGYHKAVSIVRAKHIDEILAAEKQKWEDERRKETRGTMPPVAGGGTRSRTAAGSAQLTEEELGAAKSFGMTPEKYVEAKENQEKQRLRNGMVQLVSNDLTEGGF